jgi:hypothetical protein
MSLPAWVLPFKELRTSIQYIKGGYYKYEVSSLYDPARKCTIPKAGVLWGKITEQDGFVPSSKDTHRQLPKTLPRVCAKTDLLCEVSRTLISIY